MALKGVYRLRISNMIETIYSEYLSNRPERSRPVRFNLSNEQISELNAGKDVNLNLDRIGLFRSNEENCRIVNLKVIEMDAQVVGTVGMFGDMTIEMEHSGKSVFKKDGYKYYFQNYNNQTNNPITWKTIYDPYDKRMLTDSTSAASESLLSSLFDGSSSDMLLFSRPSAWADITIKKSVHTQLLADIVVKSMRIELEYDYTNKSQFRELEVQMHDNRLMPDITVNTADLTDRTNGAGCITRTYRKDVKNVIVTVPETYGAWTFVKWTDSKGNDLPLGVVDNPNSTSVNVQLNGDVSIKAQYFTDDLDILNDDGSTIPDSHFYN